MRGWILALALMASGAAWAQAPAVVSAADQRASQIRLINLGQDMAVVAIYRTHCLEGRPAQNTTAHIEAMLRQRQAAIAPTDELRAFVRGAQAAREQTIESAAGGSRVLSETLCQAVSQRLLWLTMETLMAMPPPPPTGAGPPLPARRGD
jgi:hypothetical protein